MKRIDNIYDKGCSIDNLLLADKIARKGKLKQSGVINFDKDFNQEIADLYRELVTKTYKTSNYTTRTIYERKERVISILPYRDRVVHHAIMNVLEYMFVSVFTTDTYSCIKGKGTHCASRSLSNALKDIENTQYYLQLDIKKFYPSVNHAILKKLLRKKIKDKEMLWLLDGIIDSAPGLPIGNYLSQYFANFYLAYFDHWIKEVKGVKYYFRYADDIVILHHSKAYLHHLFIEMQAYLMNELKLTVKGNWKVSPVDDHGIDFCGYIHRHFYKLVRKITKKNIARKVAKGINRASKASCLGWLKHCNSRHLIKKLFPYEQSKII